MSAAGGPVESGSTPCWLCHDPGDKSLRSRSELGASELGFRAQVFVEDRIKGLARHYCTSRHNEHARASKTLKTS